MNSKANFFFDKPGKWQESYSIMRTIALESGLKEEVKWGCPCYTVNDSNVFLIHGFKDYCAFLFMKGALMKDPKKRLIQQTANVQSARQIRFTSAAEIIKLKSTLKSYLKEAIAIEQSGKKVEMKPTEAYPIPEELKATFTKLPAVKKAFGQLTPGRQRGYLMYFAQAKQSGTRVNRIEKSIPMIMAGKGIND